MQGPVAAPTYICVSKPYAAKTKTALLAIAKLSFQTDDVVIEAVDLSDHKDPYFRKKIAITARRTISEREYLSPQDFLRLRDTHGSILAGIGIANSLVSNVDGEIEPVYGYSEYNFNESKPTPLKFEKPGDKAIAKNLKAFEKEFGINLKKKWVEKVSQSTVKAEKSPD